MGGGSSSYFTSIDYFDLAISDRLSIGAELWFKSVKTSLPAHSALEVLQFGNDSSARTAVTGFGPRLKYAFPSTQLPLALELSFLIPTAPHLEGDSRTP
ncbi:MAG: hypothetical protein ACE5DN_06570, partial [Flavobacteriales bacterium]